MLNDQELLKTIQKEWNWALPNARRVLRTNAFGNVLIEDAQGKIYKLTPEDLAVKKIANSKDDLNKYFKDPDNLDDWEMFRLVTIAEEHYGKLQPGECFGFLTWPGLGGSYDVENMVKKESVREWVAASGYIARETHDLPDGAQVEFKITD